MVHLGNGLSVVLRISGMTLETKVSQKHARGGGGWRVGVSGGGGNLRVILVRVCEPVF